MAEEQSAEKTEEPTPKRREKFREEGNIATSQDIGGAAILATAVLVFVAGGGYLYRGIEGSFRDAFDLAQPKVSAEIDLEVSSEPQVLRGESLPPPDRRRRPSLYSPTAKLQYMI